MFESDKDCDCYESRYKCHIYKNLLRYFSTNATPTLSMRGSIFVVENQLIPTTGHTMVESCGIRLYTIYPTNQDRKICIKNLP